jgi:hypothetical protein
MVRTGKVKIHKNNDGDVCEGSLYEGITGSFGWGAALIMVLVISATMLVILPVGANLIAEPGLPSAVDQPSGCPCSGGCGTQSVSEDTQAENTGINTIEQVAQTDNSPASTVQQPVENAAAVNAEMVATDESTSVVPESANTNSIADMMGSFSSAGLISAMPSWWLSNEPGSETLYNILEKKLDVQPFNVGNGFTGWQKGSFGMFSPLFAL